MNDFWLSCGHHLLDRDEGGGLLVTDEFLKVYLARPELAPPPEACAAERSLHAAMLDNPRRPVAARELAAIADADARENWEVMVKFRDRLLHAKTLEAAYAQLVREGISGIPPMFLDQLVHVILRNVLDDCGDPLILRAGEMFYRKQRLTLHEGSLIAADDETLAGIGNTPVSPLVSMLGLPAAAEIDVITDDNAAAYWERSDQFDMAIDLTAGRPGLAALAEVLVRWIRHMLSVEVEIEPLVEVQDVNLTWYVGLDAEGTRLGDALWNGDDLDEATRSRIVGLFRLTFPDPAVVAEARRGEAVYLILAMAPDKTLRMKPQNLLTGLPVRHLEKVS